jgi:hypothetical protein
MYCFCGGHIDINLYSVFVVVDSGLVARVPRLTFESLQGHLDLGRVEEHDSLDFGVRDHAVADPVLQKQPVVVS